eukprot:TRINITY_DN30888_c0_g1_i1.p1 TRINITY_DN30888_c0_g1~~TRINITY_DN30888_c0_g1_i1.p1  ORF type:complete len:482 (-),score=55.99 TRINITY_DN30888_c0_g1_i1:321-1664(-)
MDGFFFKSSWFWLFFYSNLRQWCSAADAKIFDFGQNWQGFLQAAQAYPGNHTLSLQARIFRAVNQLLGDFDMLEVQDEFPFKGLTFVDIGCGSGLHSFAAHLLGAEVLSVDYLETSVQATSSLREKSGALMNADGFNVRSWRNTEGLTLDTWKVTQGSILEPEKWSHGETFDLVYAWGSLFVTGNQFEAIANAAGLLKPDGSMFITLQPSEDWAHQADWLHYKEQYVRGTILEQQIMAYSYVHFQLMDKISDAVDDVRKGYVQKGFKDIPKVKKFETVLRFVNLRVQEHTLARGMDLFTDARDWIGGYPFEFTQHVDLCRIMVDLQLVPKSGPHIIAGMTSVLAGRQGYAALPKRQTLHGPFGKSKRGCWHIPVPVEWLSGKESLLRMYEDEGCLGTPYGSLNKDTDNFCADRGRYEHVEGGLFFSTSDLSDPNTNGRTYSIWVPES